MPLFWLRDPIWFSASAILTAGTGGLTVVQDGLATDPTNSQYRFANLGPIVFLETTFVAAIGGAGTLDFIDIVMPEVSRKTATAYGVWQLSSGVAAGESSLLSIIERGGSFRIRNYDGGALPFTTGNNYYITLQAFYERQF